MYDRQKPFLQANAGMKNMFQPAVMLQGLGAQMDPRTPPPQARLMYNSNVHRSQWHPPLSVHPGAGGAHAQVCSWGGLGALLLRYLGEQAVQNSTNDSLGSDLGMPEMKHSLARTPASNDHPEERQLMMPAGGISPQHHALQLWDQPQDGLIGICLESSDIQSLLLQSTSPSALSQCTSVTSGVFSPPAIASSSHNGYSCSSGSSSPMAATRITPWPCGGSCSGGEGSIASCSSPLAATCTPLPLWAVAGGQPQEEVMCISPHCRQDIGPALNSTATLLLSRLRTLQYGGDQVSMWPQA